MGTYTRRIRRHTYLCDSGVNVHTSQELKEYDALSENEIFGDIPPLDLNNIKDNVGSYLIESGGVSSNSSSDAQSIISHLNKIRTNLDNKLSSVRLGYQISISNISASSSARRRNSRLSRVTSIISIQNNGASLEDGIQKGVVLISTPLSLTDTPKDESYRYTQPGTRLFSNKPTECPTDCTIVDILLPANDVDPPSPPEYCPEIQSPDRGDEKESHSLAEDTSFSAEGPLYPAGTSGGEVGNSGRVPEYNVEGGEDDSDTGQADVENDLVRPAQNLPLLQRMGISRTKLVPNQAQLLSNLKGVSQNTDRSVMTSSSDGNGLLTIQVPEWIDNMMEFEGKDGTIIKRLVTSFMAEKSNSLTPSDEHVTDRLPTVPEDKAIPEPVLKVKFVDKYGTTLLTHLPSIDLMGGIRVNDSDSSNVIVRGIGEYSLDYLSRLSKVNEKCVILRKISSDSPQENVPKPWFERPLLEKMKIIPREEYKFYISKGLVPEELDERTESIQYHINEQATYRLDLEDRDRHGVMDPFFEYERLKDTERSINDTDWAKYGRPVIKDRFK